jgi:hypothetical protein
VTDSDVLEVLDTQVDAPLAWEAAKLVKGVDPKGRVLRFIEERQSRDTFPLYELLELTPKDGTPDYFAWRTVLIEAIASIPMDDPLRTRLQIQARAARCTFSTYVVEQVMNAGVFLFSAAA